jgi:cytochrome c peroxidase
MWSKKRLVVHPVIAILLWVLYPAMARASEPFSLGPLPVLKENPQTKKEAELGKKLFFDRRLSGDGTMNCATCHIPESAFTDGQAIALSYPTTRSFRNTPTLMNVAYEKRFFLDGRAGSLEEQALGPIASPFEMNQDLDFLEEELAAVPGYRRDFKTAFGTAGINRNRIAQALAAFEKTLVSQGAPLDRYLAGEASALSPGARRGLVLFLGKAGCLRCHNGPRLSDEKFYPLLVPENKTEERDPAVLVSLRYLAKKMGVEGYGKLDVDPGRFGVTKKKEDFRAFKTPTLREIGRTAPYMHNGVFKTLEEVIDFFDQGGGEGNMVLSRLGLTAQEKDDLAVFLREGLTGEAIDLSPPLLP